MARDQILSTASGLEEDYRFQARTQMATDLTAALEILVGEANNDRPWLLSHRIYRMTKVCHFKSCCL